LCALQDFKGRVAGVKAKPVDTTGAGDAFVSGFLYNLASDPSILEVIHIFLHPLVVDSENVANVCELMDLFYVAGRRASPKSATFRQCMWCDHGDRERGNSCTTYKRRRPAI
jgi:hypothetical protein